MKKQHNDRLDAALRAHFQRQGDHEVFSPPAGFDSRVMAAVRELSAEMESKYFLRQVCQSIFAGSLLTAAVLLCVIIAGNGTGAQDAYAYFDLGRSIASTSLFSF